MADSGTRTNLTSALKKAAKNKATSEDEEALFVSDDDVSTKSYDLEAGMEALHQYDELASAEENTFACEVTDPNNRKHILRFDPILAVTYDRKICPPLKYECLYLFKLLL